MKTTKLKYICTINPTVPKHLRVTLDENVSFVPMASLTTSGQLTGIESRSIQEVLNGYRYFEEGDVLFAKITPCMENGKAGIAVGLPHSVAFGSTEFHVLRPGPALHAKYLHFFVRQASFRNMAERHMTGAGGQRRVPTDFLENMRIPLPSLDYQIRIAHLLSKVEGLIAQRKEKLQQLDELLRSIFLDMFGDPISNPNGFPVKQLSEFYSTPKDGTKCGPFGSALKKDELVESGVPVWNMDNIDPSGQMILPFRMWITEDKYQELRSYSVIDGDIIISRAGTVGKMCVVKMNGAPAIISTNLIRLRLGPKLLPLYVVSLMTHCKGRVGRLKTGADGAFTHMNTGILDKLEFPYPPIELQKQYASIAKKVEDIKSRYQQSLSEFENLYGALSQKAFKGELELSRVILTTEATEEMTPATPAVTEPKPAIQLPAPDDLSSLTGAESRMEVLGQWLNSYLEQLDGGLFIAHRFMESAQQRLWELLEDNAYQLSVAEYDHVKDLVFKALEGGRMAQNFDDDNNKLKVLSAKV